MAGKFILRAEQSASGFRNDRLTESAAFVVVDILVQAFFLDAFFTAQDSENAEKLSFCLEF